MKRYLTCLCLSLLVFSLSYSMDCKLFNQEVIKAAHANDVAKLQELNAKGNIAVVIDQENEASPLFFAIDGNAEAAVAFLLYKAHVDVNKTNRWTTSPLHFSVEKPGRKAIIALLLSMENIDLEATNNIGLTALQRAEGNSEYCDLIRAAGAKEENLSRADFYHALSLKQVAKLKKYRNLHPEWLSTLIVNAAIQKVFAISTPTGRMNRDEVLSFLMSELFQCKYIGIVSPEEMEKYTNFFDLLDDNRSIETLMLYNETLKERSLLATREDRTSKDENAVDGLVFKSERGHAIILTQPL